jgi:uncharacterized protein (TIGR02246 family)
MQEPDKSKASREQLMQASRDWSEAAEAGDLDKVASYFAEDAVIFSAGEKPVRGKQAIRAYLAEAAKIPGFKIRWEPLEGDVSGNMGYLLERTIITMDGPQGTPVTQTLQAVTVWRKTPDGLWKNVVDASVPAAQGGAQPRS